MSALEPATGHCLLPPEGRGIPSEPDRHARRAQAVVALPVQAIGALADVEIVFAHLDNTRSNQIFGPKNFVFTEQLMGVLDLAKARERSRLADAEGAPESNGHVLEVPPAPGA